MYNLFSRTGRCQQVYLDLSGFSPPCAMLIRDWAIVSPNMNAPRMRKQQEKATKNLDLLFQWAACSVLVSVDLSRHIPENRQYRPNCHKFLNLSNYPICSLQT